MTAAGVDAEYLTASELRTVEPSLKVGHEGGAAFVAGDSQIDAALAVALIRKVGLGFRFSLCYEHRRTVMYECHLYVHNCRTFLEKLWIKPVSMTRCRNFNFDHPVQSICLLDWVSLFLQRNSAYRAEGRYTELFESPVERLYR